MAKSKKPSANSLLYDKELKRLQRLVTRAENKGIYFSHSPIPEKPQRITKKRLSLIQGITASDIESQGFTVDTDTGEIFNYVPPKKSKPRKGGGTSGYNPSSFSAHISIPKASKLSPEELHKRRSEAAKRAQKTRQEREQIDPEFAQRMREQRLKALEKAREARRKWEQENPVEAHRIRSEAAKKAAETRKQREAEDPEYAERMREIRRNNLEKAREAKERKKQLEEQPQEQPEERPKVEEQEESVISDIDTSSLPNESEVVYDNVMNELNSGVNQNVANYLKEILEEEIDENGFDTVLERIATAPERAIEMASGASFASDSDDVANCAYSLLDLITGGNVTANMQRTIEELAYEDRPYRRKRR